MNFTIFQDSRKGARRYNQDRIGHWQTTDAMLMVVADGMGGHLRGELAAQLATEYIAGAFQREAKPRLANPELFLFQVLGRAHSVILQQAEKLELPESPRTTVVACVVQEGLAYWSHVGDSRLYVIRTGRILTRTRDHTRVQQLVDEGRIREESIGAHPDRNKLLQCLGGVHAPKLGPTQNARLARNDVLLLCSDGFWGPLTQRQMLTGLIGKQLSHAVPELMTLAEQRAGPQCDNVSVVAMTWGEEEVPADHQERTLPMNELPTDVQDFTATDPDFLTMSDADIEKAIADIKAALKNHPSRR